MAINVCDALSAHNKTMYLMQNFRISLFHSEIGWSRSITLFDIWYLRCAAAYLSDWTFLETTLRPHTPTRSEMKILSLDHSYDFS